MKHFLRRKLHSRLFLGVLAVLLAIILLAAALAVQQLFFNSDSKPDVLVGVDVGYGDANTVYTIANAVSGYANLIVIGSTEVTANTTALTNVCDYLYQRGFYFIVYVALGKGTFFPPQGPTSTFFQMANSRWGARFLGMYLFDEVGGKQLDFPPNYPDRPARVASNFSNVAIQYFVGVQPYLSLYRDFYYSVPQMKLYTSDYALYWYDYSSGYDVVFAEFLGDKIQNQIAVSLVRGAAKTLDKDWGAILTFGPSGGIEFHPPAFENISLYDEMLQAWQNNARYIIIFDAPGLNHTATTPYGVLTTDHLSEMKSFWNYAHTHQRSEFDPAQTAYVLPADYGYGFRGSNDTIWGLWPADAASPKIWNDTNSLMTTYGMNMDIVYETKTDDVPINLPYKTLIYWNGTTVQT
ncbi:MAG TPA: hypothetical protein VK253_04215 [Candidatus Binatia bacterium]|nr:hypothetical protein [Candidatus Binatia bacterium]